MTEAERAALVAAAAQLRAGHGWAADAILADCAGASGAAALVRLRQGKPAEAAREIGAKLSEVAA